MTNYTITFTDENGQSSSTTYHNAENVIVIMSAALRNQNYSFASFRVTDDRFISNQVEPVAEIVPAEKCDWCGEFSNQTETHEFGFTSVNLCLKCGAFNMEEIKHEVMGI